MSPDAPSPLSTYRLQFHREFTFADAARLVPYLQRLGIGALYASPYLQARPGSQHGYDISNHNRLNREIGSAEEHAAMCAALREHGMGQLLDVVPNHMGIGQGSNPWWQDVLENGPSSPYSAFFDIDWRPQQPELAGRVLLPVLGDQFGAVLENGELELRWAEGGFRIHYYEHSFPVSPKSSSLVLRAALEVLGGRLADDDPARTELESIVTALEHLPSRDRTDEASVKERTRENAVTRRRLTTLCESSDTVREAIAEVIRRFNGTPGEPHSFDLLERLLDDQAYRLAFWRVAAEEINYRRFFDINDLAGVRVEHPRVFEETHRLILRLVGEGALTGLRIDHPDGLYDPRGYLRRLQQEASRRRDGTPIYLLVEKILTGEEALPDDWPVAGTVGYAFMNRLNALYVDAGGEAGMNRAYARFIGRTLDFEALVYQNKKLILRVALASELNVLAHLLNRLSEANRRVRDFTLGSLSNALRETIACFPVYRTYIDAHVGRVSADDRAHVERAVRTAIRRNRSTSASVFEWIRDTLLLRWPDDLDAEAREEHARFVMKFQQLTGPVMAKGVEDTSFYVYNRLVSLNEVGGEPERFGISPAAFHRWIAERLAHWPTAMNSTSTHDAKRSEDVRARIDVLSEIPEAWEQQALRWAELNHQHLVEQEGDRIPDRNDEYLLYQTLLGAWPDVELDAQEHARLVERIQQYMEKATREAKVHTSWINPNPEYDAGLRDFVERILEPGGEFLQEFIPFQRRVALPGMLNAVSQTLLKLTLPGVPDVYQGQEVWNLSLVDPDNRRPVDYERRTSMLDDLLQRADAAGPAELAQSLLEDWTDGGIKLWITHRALHTRREHPALFLEGDYTPLEAQGRLGEHLLAYARTQGQNAVVVVAPRLCARLLDRRSAGEGWSDASLLGSEPLPAGRYRDAITGRTVQAEPEGDLVRIELGPLLEHIPFALLVREAQTGS